MLRPPPPPLGSLRFASVDDRPSRSRLQCSTFSTGNERSSCDGSRLRHAQPAKPYVSKARHPAPEARSSAEPSEAVCGTKVGSVGSSEGKRKTTDAGMPMSQNTICILSVDDTLVQIRPHKHHSYVFEMKIREPPSPMRTIFDIHTGHSSEFIIGYRLGRSTSRVNFFRISTPHSSITRCLASCPRGVLSGWKSASTRTNVDGGASGK